MFVRQSSDAPVTVGRRRVGDSLLEVLLRITQLQNVALAGVGSGLQQPEQFSDQTLHRSVDWTHQRPHTPIHHQASMELVPSVVLLCCCVILRVVARGNWLWFHSVATETVTSTCCSKAAWTCDTRPQTTPELWTSSVCRYLDRRLLERGMNRSSQ